MDNLLNFCCCCFLCQYILDVLLYGIHSTPKTSNNQRYNFNLIILSLLSSFVCKLLIFRYFSLYLASIFLSGGQGMLHNHITLSSFFSNTRSGLLASLVYLTLYSKSHMSFANSFSSTVPCSDFSLYQTVC